MEQKAHLHVFYTRTGGERMEYIDCVCDALVPGNVVLWHACRASAAVLGALQGLLSLDIFKLMVDTLAVNVQLMMHYSNWLIGVKNRASLRNACKTPPNTDWNNRGKIVDTQNNHPQPKEKASELTVTTHLWRKGNSWGYKRVKAPSSQIFGPAAKNWAWLDSFPYMATLS